MKNYKTIDLAKYKKKDSKFIMGRENGSEAMQKEDLLNEIKKVENNEAGRIKIVVNSEIYGIVSSFILGFFAEAVSNFKTKEKFYTVFDLSSLDEEIKKQIDEEVEYMLGE